MEIVELFGYLSALVIGISLGLIGGGGSILAVPILAYLFSVNEKVATAYSLFIVGVSSLVGGFKKHLKGYVDWKTAIIFGIPAVAGVTLVRYYVVPALPDILFNINDFEFTRRMGMFGLFAVLMIPAAFSMLKKPKEKEQKSDDTVKYNYSLILIEGLLVDANPDDVSSASNPASSKNDLVDCLNQSGGLSCRILNAAKMYKHMD